MTSLSSRKSWLYLSKKSIFSFFHIPILGYSFELLFTNGVMSDQETVIFFEFSIVELTWLVYELSYLVEKKISVRVPPYSENWVKFFSQLDMTIHTLIDSPCRVCRNMLLLNFFGLISGQKNLKNHVKIRLFIGRFKISCFGSKISKKWRFLIILKAENNFAIYFLQNELLIVAYGWVLTVV